MLAGQRCAAAGHLGGLYGWMVGWLDGFKWLKIVPGMRHGA